MVELPETRLLIHVKFLFSGFIFLERYIYEVVRHGTSDWGVVYLNLLLSGICFLCFHLGLVLTG